MAGTRSTRVLTVLDYVFVYETAREAFLARETEVPRGYGHVDPMNIAATVLEQSSHHSAEEARELVGVHVVLPQTAKASVVHRAAEWRRRGVAVTFSPQVGEGGGGGTGWRVARCVTITLVIALAIERSSCDRVILMSGEAGLLPLIRDYAVSGGTSTIELATWRAVSGRRFNKLAAAAPHTPCHALGIAEFARASNLKHRAPGLAPDA